MIDNQFARRHARSWFTTLRRFRLRLARLACGPPGSAVPDAIIRILLARLACGCASQDHTIVLAGRLERHVVVEHVLAHPFGIALEGIAVPAGSRLLERDHVAVPERAR